MSRRKLATDFEKSLSGDRADARAEGFVENRRDHRLYADTTKHARIAFGKYKDTLWSDLPGSYLYWLMRAHMPGMSGRASVELHRRRGRVKNRSILKPCVLCDKPVGQRYHVNGKLICEECRDT